jgi:large conductance mechanosensitive channel
MENAMPLLKEYKEFAIKGNMIDMAVGIVIGAAFGAIISSLVADIIMPPIGLLLGNVDFSNFYILLKEGKMPGPYSSLAVAKAAGAVTLNVGVFINTLISFLIIGFSIFFVVRFINKLRQAEAPAPAAVTTKECPYCLSVIPLKATRCAHCTADLKTGA